MRVEAKRGRGSFFRKIRNLLLYMPFQSENDPRPLFWRGTFGVGPGKTIAIREE